MTRIGIRELRQHASKFVRQVAGGATVEITERGRPVALLVPIEPDGVLEQLHRQGRLSAATGDLLDLGPPMEPSAEVVLPSSSLATAREAER